MMVAQVETEPTFGSGTPEPIFDTSRDAMTGGLFGDQPFDVSSDGERFIFRLPETDMQASGEGSFSGLIFVENWFEELTRFVPTP